MLVTDNKKEFYEVISKAHSHVLVLVSHDLDSIVSAKIVRHIFECDHIPYTIVPIRTRSELQRSYQEHRDNVKFVLLINLGATIDAVDLLMPEPDVKLFVADCHRPFHVHNIYYENNISLMVAISGLHNIEDELDKVPKYEELFWDSDIEDDIDVRDLSLEQLKKRNEFKKFESRRHDLMNKYEEFTHYSYSTSLIFFDLAWKLGKDNNELLWLAILSVVDKSNTFKLKESLFKKEITYLYDSMQRLRNIRSDQGFVLNTVAADGTQADLVTATNHLTITYEKDLNLRLYREWSLYESLRHTMYIACKFKIWKQKGHQHLHIYLADLGLPLVQCKQKFQSMDLELRQNLKQYIEDKIDKYKLTHIIDHSFIGSRGVKQKFSANDLAAAIRSLLESSDKDKSYNQKFFDAYDALSWFNTDIIQTGIALAKVQLVAIVKQVQLIIDAHLMSLMNNVMWYVVIPEGTPDATLFCHPGCLKSLAIYTLHAHASFNSKSQKAFHLPLVLITPDPERPGQGLVCGISPLLALKECRAFFKHAFSSVSRRMANVNTSWSFEESIIDPDIAYIPYKDSSAFLNELSLLFESS